ncbi:ATP-dependent RNA helicase mtr4, partial [Spiromyces aspiralis]
MDAADLFSVFNEEGEVNDVEIELPPQASTPIPANSKAANGEGKRRQSERVSPTEAAAVDKGNSIVKRARGDRHESTPIVLDSFEEDLKREVKAGGLDTSTAENGQLVLSHSVRHQVSIPAG